jgi:hypothetical protein
MSSIGSTAKTLITIRLLDKGFGLPLLFLSSLLTFHSFLIVFFLSLSFFPFQMIQKTAHEQTIALQRLLASCYSN